jgi:hypothetical protein
MLTSAASRFRRNGVKRKRSSLEHLLDALSREPFLTPDRVRGMLSLGEAFAKVVPI